MLVLRFPAFYPKIDNRSLIVVTKSTSYESGKEGCGFYFSYPLMTIYLSYKLNYFFKNKIFPEHIFQARETV